MSRRARWPSGVVVAVLLAAVATGIAWSPAVPQQLADAADGPIAHWTFDDGSGTTASDETGEHDGTLEGDTAWVTSGAAVGSGAISFDGTGDGVLVPMDAELEPGSISISAWVRGSGWGPGDPVWRTIVQKGANQCEGGSWGLDATSVPGFPGQVGSRVDSPFPNHWYGTVSVAARLWDGEWHHTAWTYDAETQTGTSWVDGHGVSNEVGPLPYGLPSADDLFIGRNPATCQFFGDFSGQLDDLQIYDRALTAAEIDSIVPDVDTTMTLELPDGPVSWGTNLELPVEVAPAPTTGGHIRLYVVDGDERTEIDSSGIDPMTGKGTFRISPGEAEYLDVGTHQLEAKYLGAGSYHESTSAIGALTLVPYELAVTLSASRTNAYLDTAVELRADVSKYTAAGVSFLADHDGTEVELGTAPLVSNNGPYKATLTIPSWTPGTWKIHAVVAATDTAGGATSNEVTIQVAKRQTETHVGAAGLYYEHEPIQVVVDVDPLGFDVITRNASGTVTVKDGTTTLAVLTLDQDGVATMAERFFTKGTHNLQAVYSGDDYHAPSTSRINVVVIDPDFVNASNVSREWSTFYPYDDDYRDTVAIRGNRHEPISVSIKIYSPTGSLVKQTSFPRATGGYSYRWNGRNGSGAILASGKYRIVQALTDAFGTKQSFTLYTTLSRKKLVTYTRYVERTGNAVSAKGAGGGGTVSTSSSGGYIKLTANNGYALAGWEFQAPSATIYKSVSFQVYAKGKQWVPPNFIGLQNFMTCPRTTGTWYDSCFERWKGVGNAAGTTAWFSTGASSSSANRSGRYVRGMITVESNTVYVYKARVKVVYAVLQ